MASGERRVVAWLIGLVMATLTAVLFLGLEQTVADRRVEQLRLETLDKVATLRARMEGEMNALLYLGSGLANYVSVHPGINADQFRRYAAQMHAAAPILRNITLAPDNVVRFLYPLEGNEAALGLDLYHHPEQGAATRKMMSSRRMVIAGPVALVQGGEALIVRIPIYVEQETGSRRYWGLTSIPIRLEQFYGQVGLHHLGEQLEIALRGRDALGEEGELFYGDPAIFGADPVLQTVNLLAGSWQIAGIPRGGWQLPWSQRLPWLGFGLLLALLIGMGSGILAVQACRLRRSEATYRDLVENVNSIVLRWRADGTITFINDYGLRLLGYSREELVGRSVIGTIVPQTESSGRDLADLMEDIARRPENHIENENENICRDGRRLWISWSNRPLLDRAGRVTELLSIGSDHSRRREMELALKQSEERFRTMVSHLHGAIYRCRVEPPWEMEFISEAISEITGYPAADFMEGRRNYAEVVHPADRDPLARKVREATAAARPFEVEYRILARDGALRWVHERGQAVRDDGDSPWLDGVIFDISDRKEAESQLRPATSPRPPARPKAIFWPI